MSTNHENDKAAKADREQLAAVRVAVDEVDEQIVSLIGRRERLIRIAGTLKSDSAEVRAPGRVERVIEHVRTAAAKKDIDPDIVESTYRAMISGAIPESHSMPSPTIRYACKQVKCASGAMVKATFAASIDSTEKSVAIKTRW